MSRQVAGVVLAAGRSTRMGVPKALLDAGGTTFVNRLAETLGRGGCIPVLVVIRSGRGPVADEVARGPGQAVINPAGRGGQIGSLRAALLHLRDLRRPPDAVVFSPVDNPAVTSETVRALVRAWRRTAAALVAPVHDGRRGHPVLADMSVADEFFQHGLADGARTVIRRDPARVTEVPVSDAAVADDLDTRERYRTRFPARRPTRVTERR